MKKLSKEQLVKFLESYGFSPDAKESVSEDVYEDMLFEAEKLLGLEWGYEFRGWFVDYLKEIVDKTCDNRYRLSMYIKDWDSLDTVWYGEPLPFIST